VSGLVRWVTSTNWGDAIKQPLLPVTLMLMTSLRLPNLAVYSIISLSQTNTKHLPRPIPLSILSPLVPTRCTLIKGRHRLICTPNLNHVEVCSVATTLLSWALGLSMINVIPGAFPTHDVVDLLPLHRLPLIIPPCYSKFVGAGPAFETVEATAGGACDLVKVRECGLVVWVRS